MASGGTVSKCRIRLDLLLVHILLVKLSPVILLRPVSAIDVTSYLEYV